MTASIFHFPNFSKYPTSDNVLERKFLQFQLYVHFFSQLFGLEYLMHEIYLIALVSFLNGIFFLRGKHNNFLL